MESFVVNVMLQIFFIFLDIESEHLNLSFTIQVFAY